MIHYLTGKAKLAEAGGKLSDAYAQNKPWPHIVVDEFFDPDVLDQVRLEATAVRRSDYYEKFVDRKTDHNKYAFAPDVVGPETSRLVNFLNSGEFVTYLENLTGISGLVADPTNDSLHGHPVAPLATPRGVERMSIALYYYTNTWKSEEKDHSTLFHISQDNKVRVRPSRVYRSVVRTLVPPIFRNSIRALKQLVRGEKISSIWDS